MAKLGKYYFFKLETKKTIKLLNEVKWGMKG